MKPKKTGKRIVSKGEFAGRVGEKAAVSFAGIFLLLFCLIAGFASIMIAYFASREPLGTGAFLAAILGSGALVLGHMGIRAMKSAKKIDVGIPLLFVNAADLPAEDSLVRASVEPVQEQEAVLLRAATADVERHEEQLVRASAGGI